MSQFIPQGIEVLVKKAAVDPAFKAELLHHRAAAAKQIGLELNAAEMAMLGAVPTAQLEAIIAGTTVPLEHRRAFLGQAAAAMLAALGIVGSAKAAEPPFRATQSLGGMVAEPNHSIMGPADQLTAAQRVADIVAEQLHVDVAEVTSDASFVDDLGANTAGLIRVRKALEKEFGIKMTPAEFRGMQTVDQAVKTIDAALKKKAEKKSGDKQPVKTKPEPPKAYSGGIRP
jgi:acyl carrier protein